MVPVIFLNIYHDIISPWYKGRGHLLWGFMSHNSCVRCSQNCYRSPFQMYATLPHHPQDISRMKWKSCTPLLITYHSTWSLDDSVRCLRNEVVRWSFCDSELQTHVWYTTVRPRSGFIILPYALMTIKQTK